MKIKWQEITLRKGTKTPKICRDMFINDNRGDFLLCIVKNGRMKHRESITNDELYQLVIDHDLFKVPDRTFNNCYTWRTKYSNNLVSKLLNQ